jgi:hypothetical protein
VPQAYGLATDPGTGFDFSLGSQQTAFLTGLLVAGGRPAKVEYFVDGADAFRCNATPP